MEESSNCDGMDLNTEDGSGTNYSDEYMEQTNSSSSELMQDFTQYRGKPYKDLTLEDLHDVEFKTIDEVDTFYSYYSLAKGFSMRRHKLDKNRARTKVIRRELVCSRQGVRKESFPNETFTEEPCPVGYDDFIKWRESRNQDVNEDIPPGKIRRTTRVHCPACFTVRLCPKRGVYYATEFRIEHNHGLASPEHRQFLRSHRHVSQHDVAQVTAMKSVSVKTCRAYEFLVHQAGGYEFVGYTLRDLYNKLQGEREEVLLDGDAQSSVTWMNMKAMRDPHFYCIFNCDEDGRLANMFWRDGQSLIDYNAFGDVLIFDTTYKSNIYGKPLAVFVGCNNHRATVLFGCALLVDETEETYHWLLSKFLTSMHGKTPISVVTDGDNAMHNAVTTLIPEARHRLCAWHIGKNVCSHLHGVDIQRDFFHFIFAGLTVEEWEAGWVYFVAMNGLESNKWVTSMYNKRERWAEAFFREHFYGGICSTQRCEGMHRNLKGGIGRHMRLYEVLPRIEKTVERIRNRVAEDDFRSENYEPVCGRHMHCLQKEIGKIFTHDIFLLIKDQINYESKFVVGQREVHPNTGVTLIWLTQYGKPERRWTVWYQPHEVNPSFTCSCKLFESDGIPCCHIFAAMKAEHVTSFPKCLVNKRWTKGSAVTKYLSSSSLANDKFVQTARYGGLMSLCAKICHNGSSTDDLYDKTMEALRRLSIQSVPNNADAQADNDFDPIHGLHPNVIRDPVVCRTKGSKSAPVRGFDAEIRSKEAGGKCSKCGRPGHNKRTCNTANPNREANGSIAVNNGTSTTVGPDISSKGVSEGDNVTASIPQQSNNASDSSDSEVEGDGTQTASATLMHHHEEVRPFEFFTGYDIINNVDSASHNSSHPDVFHLFSPFHSQ